MNNEENRDPLEITDPDELTKDLTPPDAIGGGQQPPPPAVVVVQPAGGGGGGRRKGGGGGEQTKKPTPLQGAMPSPERVKITKRLDDGRMAYIGHYAWADIQRFKSLELFISQKIVPKYRGGEYEVAFVKADGSEAPAVAITIETPMEETSAQVAPLDQLLLGVLQLAFFLLLGLVFLFEQVLLFFQPPLLFADLGVFGFDVLAKLLAFF